MGSTKIGFSLSRFAGMCAMIGALFGAAVSVQAATKRDLPLSHDDRAQIQELLYKYSYYVDNRLGEAWASTFTPDGRLEFCQTVIRGHDELVAFASRTSGRFPYTSHFVGNTIMVQTAPGQVHARSTIILMARGKGNEAPTELLGVGIYDDRIVKTRDGWRFQVRASGRTGMVPVDPDFLPPSLADDHKPIPWSDDSCPSWGNGGQQPPKTNP